MELPKNFLLPFLTGAAPKLGAYIQEVTSVLADNVLKQEYDTMLMTKVLRLD